MRPGSLGEYVTAMRQERGWSIRQVAAAIGVPASTVSRVENGGIQVPSPEVFMGLIAELDLDISMALKLCPPYNRITNLAVKHAMRPLLKTDTADDQGARDE